VIEPTTVQDLIGRWWWNYDEGRFDVLAGLLADDVRFICRTDTGATAFEDFVRCDVTGRDDVMAWQTEHRLGSPYPLRHHGTNVHVVEQRDGEAAFASYIFVTQIVEGAVANLSTGIVTGEVRSQDGSLRITRLEVVLDTQHSVPFGER
jgi:hypothetical protein